MVEPGITNAYIRLEVKHKVWICLEVWRFGCLEVLGDLEVLEVVEVFQVFEAVEVFEVFRFFGISDVFNIYF